MSKRKQAEIPGFEKQIENPAVEEAARAYCEVRDERCALSKKEKQKMLELLVVMRAHKLERYEYLDDNGEILEAIIDQGPEKAVVRKTGEEEPSIGEGLESSSHQGLINEAMKAQEDAGVEESDDGDVVPIESAAKGKAKAKRKAKK